MATGVNLQPGRGREVSNLPPTVSLRTGEAELWEAVGDVADKITDANKPNLIRRARQRGAEEGRAHQAGEIDAPRRGLLSFGQAQEAREAAYHQAYFAGTTNDADSRDNDLRREYANDVEGYERAASEMRSAFIQAAPPEFAVDIENYLNRRITSGRAEIADRQAAVATREADNALVARIGHLDGEALRLIESGRFESPEYAAATDELEARINDRVANPAIAFSQEEADALLADFTRRSHATAAARYVRDVLRDEGSAAAYDALEDLKPDGADSPEGWLAFNSARDALNRELSLEQQRRSDEDSTRGHAEREMGRLIDEDIGSLQLTGQGTGLSEAEVRGVGGNALVARWLKQRADAMAFNDLVGSVEGLPPDQAARQIAERTGAQGLRGMGPVQDAGDFDSLVAAVVQVESGGRNGLVSADPDGAGPAGGGAMGVMQVMPDTARTVAARLGVPFDENRLRTDRAYNMQIGRAYLSELLDRYNGDPFLAVTAYHAGPGNVDGWLRSVGDPRSGRMTREAWLEGVESRGNPRSAAYPRKVLEAMNAGRAAAAWEGYQGRQEQRRTDPARSVARDFSVRSAQERWLANPQNVPAGEAYVQASLDAQDRANIPAGQRRTLPVSSLVVHAGDLERRALAGDTEGFRLYSDQLIRQYGRHGRAVLQDVLEVRGDSRFAAMVSARIADFASRGQRPRPEDMQQARTAGRVEQMNRAAGGATDRNVRIMTDAEVLAAAGLGQ